MWQKLRWARLAFLLSLAVASPSKAQEQNNIWYFGNGAGLDFSQHHPWPLLDGATSTRGSTISVSDADGNLQFYSDGITVWSSSHSVINAAKPLDGDPESTHPITAVPNPVNPNQYYLFTMQRVKHATDDYRGGNYYLITKQGNGQWEITYDWCEANGSEGLFLKPTEKIVFVPYQKELEGGQSITAFWVIWHEFNSNRFWIASLDSELGEFTSQAIGAVHQNAPDDDGSNLGGAGEICASLPGDRIALAIRSLKAFEVFRFNKNNGTILPGSNLYLPAFRNEEDKSQSIMDAFGIEFSPNGRWMYGSTRNEGMLYKWDLYSNYSLTQVRDKAASYAYPEYQIGAIEMGPNGKIYFALNNQDYIGVIESPDRLGLEPYVDFWHYGARLLDNSTLEAPGGKSLMGLPRPVPGSQFLEDFYFIRTCINDQTLVYLPDPLKFGAGTKILTVKNLETDEVYNKPFDLSDQATYVFPSTGDYEVTVIGTNQRRATRQLTIHPMPEISLLGADYTYLCSGGQLTLDAGPGAFYEWDDRLLNSRTRQITTDPELLISEFKVTVTSYMNCKMLDIVKIETKSPPNLTYDSIPELCGDRQGSATVNIPANHQLTDYVFSWYNQDMQQIPLATGNALHGIAMGTYLARIWYEPTHCEVFHEFTIAGLGGHEHLAAVKDSVCPGETTSLLASGGTTYEWINPAGESGAVVQVSPLVTTTYEVKVTTQIETGQSCDTTLYQTIVVYEVFPPELGDDLTACVGDTLTLEAPDGYALYEWSNGQSGQSILISESIDQLILNVTDHHGCKSNDDIGITMNPYPQVNLGDDQLLCTNEPLLLSGGEGDEYKWQDGSTDQELSVTESGLYWLEITLAGCARRDSVMVAIHNPDDLNILNVEVKDISCFGLTDGTIEIFAESAGTLYYSIDGGDNYLENDGLFENLPPAGNYRIMVADDSVCFKSYEEILVITEPDSISYSRRMVPPDCLDCENGSVEITGISGGTPPYLVSWSDGSEGMIADNLRMGIDYTLTIEDDHGCLKTDLYKFDFSFAIPTAFTPNGDGINDKFTIQLLKYYPNARVTVFDTTGKTVYASLPQQAFSDPWDGTDEGGQPLPFGTYYFIIQLDPDDVSIKPITGHLTLLK